jgi:polar amino acid transport system substrate-binding protein
VSGARVRTAVAAALAVGALATTAACGSSGAPAPVAAVRHGTLDRALHDRLPQSVQDTGALRVGTDASYAPMSMFGPDGRTVIGMEPDLAAEIGRVLGVRLELVDTDFDSLLGDVATGRLDLAMSAVTDTAERARTVDFVDYFSAGTAIVVQRGNPAGITDLRDLCGHAVAVERATIQVDLLRRAQHHCAGEPIDVRTYPTNSDALLQLRTGRVASVLNDLPPAVYLTTDRRTRQDYQLASTTQYEPGPYGIAVSQDQPGLRDALRTAVQRLVRDGVYLDVLGRWHVRSGAIREVTVDLKQ